MFADESPDWNLDLNGSAECELCGEEPATMHLLRVVDGSISHTHLCAGCAEQMAGEETEGLALVLAVPSVLRGFAKKALPEERGAAGGSTVSHEDSFCGSCGSFLEWTGSKVEEPAAESPAPEPESQPLEPEHQLDQLFFAQVFQITAVHRPMDSDIAPHGKGKTAGGG